MWAESVLQLCSVNQVHVLRTLIAIGDTGMGEAFACVMISLQVESSRPKTQVGREGRVSKGFFLLRGMREILTYNFVVGDRISTSGTL